MRGHRDLRLVAAAASICAVGTLIAPLGEARAVFAVPLTLLLPGYAISMAIAGAQKIDPPALVPLATGLSISALALGSVILNYTPGGLRGLPWTLLLALLVLGSCRIAAQRRPRSARWRTGFVTPRATPAAALLLVGCVAVSAVALVLAQATVPADRAFGYTELWLNSGGAPGGPARVGVTSQRQDRAAFRLEVRLGDREEPIIRNFGLDPGETRTVALEPRPTPAPVRIEAKLYERRRSSSVFRKVFGWLPAAGESTR